MEKLKEGAHGESVKHLQKQLQEAGINLRFADGIFGYETVKAITEFQKKRNLTPDGVVGSQTLYALDFPNAKPDLELVALLKRGTNKWNEWRTENSSIEHPNLELANLRNCNLAGANLAGANLGGATLIRANLREADLRNTNLNSADLNSAQLFKANLENADLGNANGFEIQCSNANFKNANLCGCNFMGSNFKEADLRNARLRDAIFIQAQLDDADLSEADLSNAILNSSELRKTKFVKANLSGADISGSMLVETNFEYANLSNCLVYGIAAWDVRLEGTEQLNLIITNTSSNVATITVDDLQVAQFIYLLLNNKNIRKVIDTITSKAVLILGRFTNDRKIVLDALKDELRKRNYLPILFDFEASEKRDLTETISTLAHMSRFIIADLTDAKSIPQELQVIIPDLPSVPVQPLLLSSQSEYAMFEHFKRYPWVLPIFYYMDKDELIKTFFEKIITPLELKFKEQTSG